MKVAVVGKGGSGKTTTAAVLARSLARRGHDVVALDCDTNANLGISLGIGFEPTEQLVSMRERVDDGEADHAEDPGELLAQFGLEAPDGVQLAVVTRIQNIDPGCMCCGLSPDQLLGTFDAPDRIVIADLEAGIGTLTRIEPGSVDVVLVVAEPTEKSLDVAERARDLALDKQVARIVVIASKVATEADLDAITDRFGDLEVVAVPDDRAVMRADREGVALLDHSPDTAAVKALSHLTDILLEPQPVA